MYNKIYNSQKLGLKCKNLYYLLESGKNLLYFGFLKSLPFEKKN